MRLILIVLAVALCVAYVRAVPASGSCALDNRCRVSSDCQVNKGIGSTLCCNGRCVDSTELPKLFLGDLSLSSCSGSCHTGYDVNSRCERAGESANGAAPGCECTSTAGSACANPWTTCDYMGNRTETGENRCIYTELPAGAPCSTDTECATVVTVFGFPAPGCVAGVCGARSPPPPPPPPSPPPPPNPPPPPSPPPAPPSPPPPPGGSVGVTGGRRLMAAQSSYAPGAEATASSLASMYPSAGLAYDTENYCSRSNLKCPAGTACVSKDNPNDNTVGCYARRAVGSFCRYHSDCESGVCDTEGGANVCMNPFTKAAGTNCTSSYECESMRCDSNSVRTVCSATVGSVRVNDACVMDAECGSGLRCVGSFGNKKCKSFVGMECTSGSVCGLNADCVCVGTKKECVARLPVDVSCMAERVAYEKLVPADAGNFNRMLARPFQRYPADISAAAAAYACCAFTDGRKGFEDLTQSNIGQIWMDQQLDCSVDPPVFNHIGSSDDQRCSLTTSKSIDSIIKGIRRAAPIPATFPSTSAATSLAPSALPFAVSALLVLLSLAGVLA